MDLRKERDMHPLDIYHGTFICFPVRQDFPVVDQCDKMQNVSRWNWREKFSIAAQITSQTDEMMTAKRVFRTYGHRTIWPGHFCKLSWKWRNSWMDRARTRKIGRKFARKKTRLQIFTFSPRFPGWLTAVSSRIVFATSGRGRRYFLRPDYFLCFLL